MVSNVANGSHPTQDTNPKSSRRPKESRFLQQELPACKPLLTPKWVIMICLVIGVIFIPIGVISLSASNSVVEVTYRYDNECLNGVTDKVQYIQNSTTNKSCTAYVTVPKTMKPPIYVYYELDNYYQNHRRYVKSKSDNQLLKGINATDSSNCKPEQYLGNNDSLPIIPCGLIAWSLFNDTYQFKISNTDNLTVNKTGISWKSDRDHKFGSNVYPLNFPNNQINASGILIGGAMLQNVPLNQNEDLIVWMRTAAFPTFRKLYGRIETTLVANTNVTINILNQYNTYSFDGKKRVILSTTSWLGGKNDFLGIAYITMGSISVFFALIYFAAHLTRPRSLGDVNYLSWNKRTTART